MSAFSQFLGNGVFVNDPTLLPRNAPTADSVARANVGSDGSTFFTGGSFAIDRIPGSVQVDSNWTLNTYKTIANISGQSGIVSCFVGPTLPTSGDTNTWRITVDGSTPYVIVMTTAANASRCLLGAVFQPADFYATPLVFGATAVSPDGLTLASGTVNTGIQVPSPYDFPAASRPLLRYTSSLLVEAQISVNLTTTTNSERRCAFVQQRTT